MKRRMPGYGKHQRGFALVAAIFIIVVLALLGIMTVTISSMQRATASTAAQGTRAYYAARAGIEWGTYQATQSTPSCAPTTTFPLAVSGLSGISVTVLCQQLSSSAVQHQEYGQSYYVFALTSTATSGNFGDADFVSRTINAVVTTALPP